MGKTEAPAPQYRRCRYWHAMYLGIKAHCTISSQASRCCDGLNGQCEIKIAEEQFERGALLIEGKSW